MNRLPCKIVENREYIGLSFRLYQSNLQTWSVSGIHFEKKQVECQSSRLSNLAKLHLISPINRSARSWLAASWFPRIWIYQFIKNNLKSVLKKIFNFHSHFAYQIIFFSFLSIKHFYKFPKFTSGERNRVAYYQIRYSHEPMNINVAVVLCGRTFPLTTARNQPKPRWV